MYISSPWSLNRLLPWLPSLRSCVSGRVLAAIAVAALAAVLLVAWSPALAAAACGRLA